MVQGNIYHRVFNIYSKMVPCRYCVHIFTRYCTHLYQVLYTFLPGTVHISTRYSLYGPTRYLRTRITSLDQFVTWQGSICLVRPYQVPRPRVCDTFLSVLFVLFFPVGCIFSRVLFMLRLALSKIYSLFCIPLLGVLPCAP